MELSAEINRFHAKHGMSRGSKTVVRVAGAGTLVPVQNPESVLKPMWGFLQHLQTYGYCMRTD